MLKKLLPLSALCITALSFSLSAQAEVYELRTYTTLEGRLDALLARFEDHTMRIFENHNMRNVAYWVPQDEPLASNTLVYIIAHENREQAAANWSAFGSDPEWQEVAEASQMDGAIIEGVESVFMDIEDWSPAL